jgi:hypothetical protein
VSRYHSDIERPGGTPRIRFKRAHPDGVYILGPSGLPCTENICAHYQQRLLHDAIRRTAKDAGEGTQLPLIWKCDLSWNLILVGVINTRNEAISDHTGTYTIIMITFNNSRPLKTSTRGLYQKIRTDETRFLKQTSEFMVSYFF